MSPEYKAAPSIPVPSADLINYRFDEADKKFAQMNNKLDVILSQTSQFTTEDQVNRIVNEALRPTNDQLANYRWYWRAVTTAVLVALATAVAGLIYTKR